MSKLDDIARLGPPGLARQIVRGPGRVVTEEELRELRRQLAAKAMPSKASSPVAGQKPRTGPPSQKALIKAAEKRAKGRPRVHETNGLRQAAYRDRKKGKTT